MENEKYSINAIFRQSGQILFNVWNLTSSSNRPKLFFMLPKPQKYNKCLWKHFGLTTFKPLQWQIIHEFLRHPQGRDICAIIATGYGKSLSYQFPAFFLNKVVVVISPLIALMEDQVTALNQRSQSRPCACLLGTAQEDRTIKERILGLEFKLVYATPEYITRGNGLKMLRDLGHNLALIAIDEAHCISKWGHEFRPAYRQLSQLRTAVPRVRLLALTGTATRRVRLDICNQLQMRQPVVLCSGLDRPNLELTVRERSTNLWSDLQQYLSWAAEVNGSVIIYSNTIRDTEHMAQELCRHGSRCHSYHSKLPLEEKRRNQQEFTSDQVRIIAATTAFGMGIDKPNVRLVVHYGAPSDMERYYQEIGRAGRDGLPAKCVLFYSDSDAEIHRRLQHSQPLTAQRSEELQQLANAMQEYTQTSQCRRQYILNYFDDCATLGSLLRRANCCDNCRKARQLKSATETDPSPLDVTHESRLLLSMLRDVNGRVGLGNVIKALRGSQSKCVSSECRNHENYGSAGHRSIAWLKALAQHLKTTGYIKNDYVRGANTNFGFLMPQVTLQGCCWLDEEQTESEKIIVQPDSRLARLPQTCRNNKRTKSILDWGSDFDPNELGETVEEGMKQTSDNDMIWGPDLDIDFKQIDDAVAQATATKQATSNNELESLLADCQKILHEEHEDAARTLKARKRVWQYLEGSYKKQPLIPKYKYAAKTTN